MFRGYFTVYRRDGSQVAEIQVPFPEDPNYQLQVSGNTVTAICTLPHQRSAASYYFPDPDNSGHYEPRYFGL